MTQQAAVPAGKQAVKRAYYAVILKDRVRGLYPVQSLVLAGVGVHARTATYDYEAQEASYHPGQTLRLTDEQAQAALAYAKRFRVQWVKLENGWRSEVVDPASKVYEPLETTCHPETGQVMSQEVELADYVVIRPHPDDMVPPAPPAAAGIMAADAKQEQAAAAAVEAEEEAADPKGFAADKADMRRAKRGQ